MINTPLDIIQRPAIVPIVNSFWIKNIPIMTDIIADSVVIETVMTRFELVLTTYNHRMLVMKYMRNAHTMIAMSADCLTVLSCVIKFPLKNRKLYKQADAKNVNDTMKRTMFIDVYFSIPCIVNGKIPQNNATIIASGISSSML
jgi:hypothetical protein